MSRRRHWQKPLHQKPSNPKRWTFGRGCCESCRSDDVTRYDNGWFKCNNCKAEWYDASEDDS